jgi:hypothetical protein
LTDQSGKTWQLAGDTSKLSDHVGHQVRIMGTDNSGSASGSSSGSMGSSASPSSGSTGSSPSSSSGSTGSSSGTSSGSSATGAGSSSSGSQSTFNVKKVKMISSTCSTTSK